MMVAMLMEDLLEELGHQVTGSAAHLSEGLTLARTGEFDFAVLDINLGGASSGEIAEVLAQRGIPFMFASGYGRTGLPPERLEAVVIQKPFDVPTLSAALDQLLGGELAA